MTQAHTHIPIALVGGGLTTQVLALCLVYCGFDFIWFSGPPASTPDRPDTRTTTIHHAGRVMLETLGIWGCLPMPAWPITQIAVAGATAEPASNRQRRTGWPLCWEQADPPMAWVLSNQSLKTACEAGVRKQLSQHQIQPVWIEVMELGQPNLLKDSQNRYWSCDLVIACDGAGSGLRRQAGLRAVDQSRDETALVTIVGTERAIGTTAYQRFLPTGPLALMPVGARCASVVWSLPTAQAKDLHGQDRSAFTEALTAAFGADLGQLEVDAPCLSWPLQPAWCPKISTAGFVLAGDAAHAVHPLAGMGFNLALADSAVLLDCLQNAVRSGLNAGHISLSSAYQARRAPEILALTAATQGLNRLLSRPDGPLYQLACIGMSVLGQVPARRLLSDLAMGGRLATAPLFNGDTGLSARP